MLICYNYYIVLIMLYYVIVCWNEAGRAVGYKETHLVKRPTVWSSDDLRPTEKESHVRTRGETIPWCDRPVDCANDFPSRSAELKQSRLLTAGMAAHSARMHLNTGKYQFENTIP